MIHFLYSAQLKHFFFFSNDDSSSVVVICVAVIGSVFAILIFAALVILYMKIYRTGLYKICYSTYLWRSIMRLQHSLNAKCVTYCMFHIRLYRHVHIKQSCKSNDYQMALKGLQVQYKTKEFFDILVEGFIYYFNCGVPFTTWNVLSNHNRRTSIRVVVTYKSIVQTSFFV